MKSLDTLRDKLQNILIENNGDVKLSEHKDIIDYAKELGLTDGELRKELNKADSLINWDNVRKEKAYLQKRDNDFRKAVEIQKMNEANASETLQYIIELSSRDNIFDVNEIKIFFETSNELNQNEIESAKILKSFLDENEYAPINTPKGISLRLLLESTDWKKSIVPLLEQPVNNKKKGTIFFWTLAVVTLSAISFFVLKSSGDKKENTNFKNEDRENVTIPISKIPATNPNLDSSKSQATTVTDSTKKVAEKQNSENYDLETQKIKVENLLTRYYKNLNETTFDANEYFASNVNQYITYNNISADEINKLHTTQSDYINNVFTINSNTIKFDRMEDGINYWQYWGNYNCYRVSRRKNQTCDVSIEVGINENDKIASYKELLIRNLKFY